MKTKVFNENKQYFHENIHVKKKKEGWCIYIFDKVDFKEKKIFFRNKEGPYILTKGFLFQPESDNVLNMHVLNNTVSKYIKENLADI